jgi:hypothetical protein
MAQILGKRIPGVKRTNPVSYEFDPKLRVEMVSLEGVNIFTREKAAAHYIEVSRVTIGVGQIDVADVYAALKPGGVCVRALGATPKILRDFREQALAVIARKTCFVTHWPDDAGYHPAAPSFILENEHTGMKKFTEERTIEQAGVATAVARAPEIQKEAIKAGQDPEKLIKENYDSVLTAAYKEDNEETQSMGIMDFTWGEVGGAADEEYDVVFDLELAERPHFVFATAEDSFR